LIGVIIINLLFIEGAVHNKRRLESKITYNFRVKRGDSKNTTLENTL